MNLEQTEAECAANAKAPRVSLESIQRAIVHQFYTTALDAIDEEDIENLAGDVAMQLSIMTICIVVMDNGFTVIGKSAPASPENFNAALGQKLAFDDCVRQLSPLMGFALRERLARRESA